ncbi:MAG: endonuclease MutS2 [candidate division NC10 bacterium]|nr:endonuclease MutS2 [candidate division NC10 bacterium]
MDSHTLRVLEFSEVLHHLAAGAASVLGRQRAVLLSPSPDAEVVVRRLAETREGCELLRRGPLPGLERAQDIRGLLARAAIPGVRLSPQELLAIADTLDAASHLRRHVREAGLPLPELRRIAAGLTPPAELAGEIRRCITPDGAVPDTASPTLFRLRAEARRSREAVRQALQELLQAPQVQPVLAEPVITLRNDRYVIPVRPDYRTHLQGIVQDQSASGQTLFLEPLSVVERNNAIRRLEREADAEVDRLLGELTSAVRASGPAIASTLEALADLDLILAKARLAERWHGALPRMLCKGALRLLHARHPLLLERRRDPAQAGGEGEVVPIDVTVGPDARVLVITGPNTGGKTVALKTIGLAALMAQSGLFIPASPDSELPVYDSVYADIGDEQSLAQDLSTFSAHVARLRTTLQEAGPKSLVLLDEIGAGTDPGEGSALGNAVLEALAGRGCHVLATTHLDAVKAFVARDPRMVNAAVEFDLDSLRPLYTLHIGLPGRSFAIDIACRLGIPPTIIQRSRELLGDSGAEVTALLSRLHAQEQRRDADAVEAARERAAASAARQAAEKLALDLRDQIAAVRAQARQLVGGIAAEARRRAEAVVADLARGGSIREAREAIRGVSQAAEARLAALPVPEVSPGGEAAPAPVEPGQRVFVRHLGQAGTVLSPVGAQGLVEVQLPVGKTRVPLEALAPVPAAVPAARPQSEGGITWTAGAGDSLAAEINVIGCTVEEGTGRVQRYLEDAALGGLTRVRIIHGKGTGRLRRGIAELLKSHPLVAGFQIASFEEGGSGATIVDLGTREAGDSAPERPASPRVGTG